MADYREAVLDSLDTDDDASVLYQEAASTDVTEGKKSKKGTTPDGPLHGLVITDKDGNKYDRDGSRLFDLLNQRCGSIFKLLDSGEIAFAGAKRAADVVSDEKASKSLATLVENNIGDNASQIIKLRVGSDFKDVNFDAYENGLVDYEDVQFSGLKDHKNAAQAAIFYHFLYERINTTGYEENIAEKKTKGSNFDTLHNTAKTEEVKAWNDISGGHATLRLELDWQDKNVIDHKTGEPEFRYKGLYYDDIGIQIRRRIRDGKLNFTEFVP